MVSNFEALKATFGSQGGGCDMYLIKQYFISCAANMMRFWCEYTCSPKQKDFVKFEGYGEVPDP